MMGLSPLCLNKKQSFGSSWFILKLISGEQTNIYMLSTENLKMTQEIPENNFLTAPYDHKEMRQSRIHGSLNDVQKNEKWEQKKPWFLNGLCMFYMGDKVTTRLPPWVMIHKNTMDHSTNKVKYYVHVLLLNRIFLLMNHIPA